MIKKIINKLLRKESKQNVIVDKKMEKSHLSKYFSDHDNYSKNNNSKNDILNYSYKNNTDNYKENNKLTKFLNNEDYYAKLAETYVENNETVIEDVISESEMEQQINFTNVLGQQNNLFNVPNQHDNSLNVDKSEKKDIIKKYVFPPLDIFNHYNVINQSDIALADEQKNIINQVLKNFKINCFVKEYKMNPVFTLFYVQFDESESRIDRIKVIKDNLSLRLSCNNISISSQIDDSKCVAIKVFKKREQRGNINLGDMLSDDKFQKIDLILPVAIGINSYGEKIYLDITKMRHILCAGATMTGKTVFLKNMIISLLYKISPSDLKLILVDTKEIEFSIFKDIPHLAMPIISSEYIEYMIYWLMKQMEYRLKLLKKYNSCNFDELNKSIIQHNENKLPYFVLIIDECSDCIEQLSSISEFNIIEILKKGHFVGIHLIISTQRPTVNILNTLKKDLLSTKVVFNVSSPVDSHIILGKSGAEKLEGRGDMILRFPGMSDIRLQGSFVSNKEIKSIVEFLTTNNEVDYIVTLEELQQSSISRGDGNGSSGVKMGRDDEYFKEVCYYVVRNQNASVNQLQKIFGTNFNRMDNIFRDMQSLGIVSPTQPGTKRKVLVNEAELEEILNNI